jgi:hypothetical protein
MNDKKLSQLFGAAKKVMPAAPAQGFDLLVMQQIRRNPARSELSISDLLSRWFPRLALAAAAVIVVCVVGEYVSTGPTLSESAAQLSVPELAEN